MIFIILCFNIKALHFDKKREYIFIIGLIKFLVPINIHSFVFSPYKIKSHFLVLVTFSLSILGTKAVDGNF